MVGVCLLAQEEEGQDTFEANMPQSPLEIQSVPILVENLCVLDALSRRREVKAQHRRRRKSLLSSYATEEKASEY